MKKVNYYFSGQNTETHNANGNWVLWETSIRILFPLPKFIYFSVPQACPDADANCLGSLINRNREKENKV